MRDSSFGDMQAFQIGFKATNECILFLRLTEFELGSVHGLE